MVTINQLFENMIYFLIFISMVLLVLDNPMNDHLTDLSQFIKRLDYIITICFTIEAFCRIVASGFFSSSVSG